MATSYAEPMLLVEPDDLARVVRSSFREAYGREAHAVGRAPGRVNVVGEHTDYHGGRCLPIALPHATWVAVADRDDRTVRVRSTAYDDTWQGRVGDRPRGWAAYVVGALAAVGHRGGLDVLVDSTVPVGAGLASSAAVVCAVARAVSPLAAEGLLGPCVRAEAEEVGAPTGGLDQTVALLAQPGHALLLDFTDHSRRHVPWRPEEAGLELLVVDTRTRHAHADGGYRLRRTESEEAMRLPPASLTDLQARRRRHVLTENDRVLAVVAALERNAWDEVGRLLTASHRSLRDDYEVSCPELDVVVDACLAAGALGARMTGGGFGGCAIVLTPASLRDRILAAASDGLARLGGPEPRALVATAAGPATREVAPMPEQPGRVEGQR